MTEPGVPTLRIVPVCVCRAGPVSIRGLSRAFAPDGGLLPVLRDIDLEVDAAG